METKTLTKQQALEHGYELCGSHKNEWQHLTSVQDLCEDDFNGEQLFLAEKEGDSPTTNSEDIREMIADMMESNWGNDTGDDTEEVYNTIMKLDFSVTADMINKALEFKKSYRLTDISVTL